MSGVVCAIRGGPDSQPTIVRAISLAQISHLPLYLVYIVNLDFLTHTSSSRIQTLSAEMHQMGEFILLTAQSLAEAQGVAAQGVVRHGNVGQEIINLCREIGADYLVLGNPRPRGEESVFTSESITQFISQIENQTGAKVILASPSGGEHD